MRSKERNRSFRLAGIHGADAAADLAVFSADLNYAESVSENCLCGARYQALPKLVGRARLEPPDLLRIVDLQIPKCEEISGMGATDPIADLLTRIRNAYMAFHETLVVPHSKTREAMVKILKEEGYLSRCEVVDGKPFKSISITLKYAGDREPAIRKLRRISKPGRRVYVSKIEIPSVLSGLGITILSTSKGVLTGKKAQEEGLGGELLCEVY